MKDDFVIIADEVTKHYGSLLAVDHVSFKVLRGEFFGFLGPNGAGKTTTVRMLTGVLPPDEGRVFIEGINIFNDPFTAKRVMGVVPEVSNPYVDLSAWDNLMFMGELYGVPRREREERAEELLRMFGLYERRKHPVKAFSKGMKQRLVLCMALVHNPKVLFLDEPTSGLDVQSTRLIRDVLRRLNREEGVTVFLTTHNMHEANELCDRVAVINHGRLIALDRPDALRVKFGDMVYVEFSFNKPVSLEDASSFLGWDVEAAGGRMRVCTRNPDVVIKKVIEFSREFNVKISSLNTVVPSLEDVFIRLVEGDKCAQG